MQVVIKYPEDPSKKASLSTLLRRRGFKRDQVILVNNGDKTMLENLITTYGGEILGVLSHDTTTETKAYLKKMLDIFVKLAKKQKLVETDFQAIKEVEALCQE